MEQAVKYMEHMKAFETAIAKAEGVSEVKVIVGRRFDRLLVDGVTRYFVERHTWEIFGAKSSFQFNPRRMYGKLDTISQFDWSTNKPITGTPAEKEWIQREESIAKSYKPRGRPKKS